MRISTRVQYLGCLRQGKATRDSIPCNGVTGLYNTIHIIEFKNLREYYYSVRFIQLTGPTSQNSTPPTENTVHLSVSASRQTGNGIHRPGLMFYYYCLQCLALHPIPAMSIAHCSRHLRSWTLYLPVNYSAQPLSSQ